MIKRIFDLTGSSFGLILLSPILLILAILIKIGSPGPLFYRGLRAGLSGKPFKILKFRSMVVNADKIGGPSTAGDDPRVTKIGAFMRRFKLDELPQLFNVLIGQMSFVGPRPEVLTEVAEYDAAQRKVLDIRPGITDWASIWNSDEGAILAGAADPHLVYKQRIQPTKLKLQLLYVNDHSLFIDLKILVYTIVKLFRKKWLPEELTPFGKP
jgi:lipopolysaccharide/colanic/teichoic acid biosynthesis glycosyltransferase